MTETVNIGGLSADNQTFAASTEMGSSFSAAGGFPDGLIGMAFAPLSFLRKPPFFREALVLDKSHFRD